MEQLKLQFRLKYGYYDPKFFLGTDVKPWTYENQDGKEKQCWAFVYLSGGEPLTIDPLWGINMRLSNLLNCKENIVLERGLSKAIPVKRPFFIQWQPFRKP